jgi:hypothetical protein
MSEQPPEQLDDLVRFGLIATVYHEGSIDALSRAAARANTPHTILHDGMKYVLYLNESLKQRRGSSLTLRLALCPKHRAYVIGTLIEYSDA